jgi:glycerophosphoryl diester phosphodiesterase
LAGPKQVITWAVAKEARDNRVEVILFAPNTRKNFERYCAWPVDALITDYPDMGHCP